MVSPDPFLSPREPRPASAGAATADTARLRRLLQDHLPPPAWCLAFEVQAAGVRGLSYADAVGFEARATGLVTHGFELKVSRGDLLNERDLLKNAGTRDLVDYWWLVLGSKDLLRGGWKPPADWGILYPGPGQGLVTHRVPARLRPAGGLDRRLVGAFLNRFQQPTYRPAAYWKSRERDADAAGYARGYNAGKRTSARAARRGPLVDDDEPLNLP